MSDYSHFANKQTTLEKLAEKKKNVKNAEKIYSTLMDEIKHEMELVKKKLSKKEEEQGSWIIRVGDAKAILKEVEARDIHSNKISGDEYFVGVFTKLSTNYIQTIKEFKPKRIDIEAGFYRGRTVHIQVKRHYKGNGFVYSLVYTVDPLVYDTKYSDSQKISKSEEIYDILKNEIKKEIELLEEPYSEKEEKKGHWLIEVRSQYARSNKVKTSTKDVYGNKLYGDDYYVDIFDKNSTSYLQTIKRFKISKVKIAKGPYKGYSFYVYVPRQHIPDGIYTLKYELDQGKKPIDQHVPFPVRPSSDD
jgi:RNA binding exosome subunit